MANYSVPLRYIPKKLNITIRDFNKILNEPIRSHYDFPNDKKIRSMLRKIKKLIKIV